MSTPLPRMRASDGPVVLAAADVQRLLPQFEVLGVLGCGGMGVVYRARQRSLERLVALKVLPGAVGEADPFRYTERFRREARTMAQLSHPAIVPVHDFGETAEGQLFYAMELIEGTDVAAMIEQHGCISPDQAVNIALSVCDALAYAHARGVVHRDIKPANILLDAEGRVKVADFGVARVHDLTRPALTATNLAIGTPDFAAPELFHSGSAIDHRVDLYALGATLYQMLTGRIARGMFKLPSLIDRGIDPRFDRIICKALESDPADRFQSASEMRAALEELRVPAPQAPRAKTTPTRRKASTIAALAVLCIGTGALVYKSGRKPAQPLQAPPDTTASSQLTILAPDESGLDAFSLELARLPAEQQFVRVVAKLEELNGARVRVEPSIRDGKLRGVRFSRIEGETADISPIAAFRDLTSLELIDLRPADLAPLASLKLERLDIQGGAFTDLTPISKLPLRELTLRSVPAKNFDQLKGMRLQKLAVEFSELSVHTLQFAKGMPLTHLSVRGTPVRDFSPIVNLPLVELVCSDDATPLPAHIQKVPTLRTINGIPVEEYLRRPAWIDWLGPRLARGEFSTPPWSRMSGGITSDTHLLATEVLPASTRDGAVRVTYSLRGSHGVMITIRGTARDGGVERYVAQDTGQTLYIGHIQPDNAVPRLVSQKVPETIRGLENRSLEFRFIGDRLIATANGVFTVETRQPALKEGACAVVLTSGVLIRKIEVQPLDPPPR